MPNKSKATIEEKVKVTRENIKENSFLLSS